MVNGRILNEISREDYFSDAVRYFWDKRASQAEDQNHRGVIDQGIRSEATGGKHMDGFFSLIKKLLIDIGVPEEESAHGGGIWTSLDIFVQKNSGIYW